jgi:serine-threonine kinase receptor-associated protein
LNKEVSSLVSGGEDGTVRVWDLRSNSIVRQSTFGACITSVERSTDGSILTIADGKNIHFCDATSLETLKTLQTGTSQHSASMHPSSGRVVAGGLDFHLHVFAYPSLEALEEHSSHHGPVHVVRYSPDGELYASGSEDGTVRLWQNDLSKEYGTSEMRAMKD